MNYRCHAIGCGEEAIPKMPMCLKHWQMVPKAVRVLIWAHYRLGQEVDKNPSEEYLALAFVSISCVALKEGKGLPEFQVKRTINSMARNQSTDVI